MSRRQAAGAKIDQTVKVIGYIRVSTAAQVESGAGLEAQKQAIQAEADRRGWRLIDIVVDEGLSGKTMNRPGMRGALEMLQKGEADALMASKLDRLSRSVKDFAEMMDQARRYGWHLIALDLGVDTSTPAGEAMANVMATFAQFERRMIGMRTREGLAVKKAQGVILGAPVAIGGDAQAMILDMRRQGLSMAKIADRLNADRVPTARGGAWHASTVRVVLQRADRQAVAA
jgi:DNA invertase Pin-like site-specific DNA recombinase